MTDGLDDHPLLRGGRPGMWETLGFELVESGSGRAVLQGTTTPAHENGAGVIHGGLAAALIDSATGSAILTAVEAGAAIATVDLNITYTRPIPLDAGTLTATAVVDHVGRTVAVASCEVRDSRGRIVTLGRATYAVRSS